MMKRFCDRCSKEIPASPGEPGSPPSRFEVRVGALKDYAKDYTHANTPVTVTDITHEMDLCRSCWGTVKTVLEGKQ